MSAPTIAAIQRHVAEQFGVTVNDLASARTARNVTLARHLAMWLCRALTKHTATMIGKRFGGRDHSTVTYAWRRAEARMEADPALKAEVEALQAAILTAVKAPAACSPVRDTELELRGESHALRERAARLDALADGLAKLAEAEGAPPG